jgi:hypothetical protein
MLRPANSLLGSSRAARRASFRAEWVKSLGHAVRGVRAGVVGLFGAAIELVLLCCLPLVYFASSYLALDLPARWLAHREPFSWQGFLVFAVAAAVGLVGIARSMQHSPPVAPVRPQFARTMLTVGWIAAVLMTIGDMVS